jgi:hypothetical protein
MLKYVISAPLFWGFTVELDPCAFENDEDVVSTIKLMLRAELMELNLIPLCEKLDETDLKIYDRSSPVVYVCSCDHGHEL